MLCEIVAVGTELLLGQIVDTNSAWIGEQLALAGIDCQRHTAVGDNRERMLEAFRDALG
ncbi:MAG TPA: competence/damage-inducible protein A, partial [Acidimicrobiaceae bacterium]|nr:competence/damage-inducible protein A [Acidimicrobiaceae bacterium]